jgi:hypothetical protein
MLVVVVHFNAVLPVLHPGYRSSGETQVFWLAVVFAFMAVSLATVFKPRLKYLSLIVGSPLILALLGKALYFGWLGHRTVYANDILILGLSCFAIYMGVAYQIYTWGFRLAHIAYFTLWLVVGLLPVAYAFAYETEVTSNTTLNPTGLTAVGLAPR